MAGAPTRVKLLCHRYITNSRHGLVTHYRWQASRWTGGVEALYCVIGGVLHDTWHCCGQVYRMSGSVLHHAPHRGR